MYVHFVADRGDLAPELVGRLGGGHKNNLLEVELFQGFAGKNQMCIMDRIEGTAINANFFQGAAKVAQSAIWQVA
jgi:hypothetical protein